MKITLGEEQIIAVGPRHEDDDWGTYQFPKLHCADDGSIAVEFHVAQDDWRELGGRQNERVFITTDNGAHWKEDASADLGKYGVLLPNGDRLFGVMRENPIWDLTKIEMPVRRPGSPYACLPDEPLWEKSDDIRRLPPPRGGYYDIMGQFLNSYAVADLPEGLLEHPFEWEFYRLKKGETVGKKEWAPLDWPNLGITLCGHQSGKSGCALAPQLLGRIKVAPDGTLWAATYFDGLNPKNGAYSPYNATFVLNSADNGYHWKLISYIPYIPDNEEYVNAYLACGYVEPELEFMPDGSMIMLLRIADVMRGDNDWAPSYITRSTDNGKTWSKPTRFDSVGVLPRMCRVKNATLAIYGRPGIFVRATTDPSGMKWEAPVEVMTPNDRSALGNEPKARPNFHQWAGSCCNCDIIALDDTHAMIAYSDFVHPCADGVKRKAIVTRVLTITE